MSREVASRHGSAVGQCPAIQRTTTVIGDVLCTLLTIAPSLSITTTVPEPFIAYHLTLGNQVSSAWDRSARVSRFQLVAYSRSHLTWTYVAV